VAPGSHGEATRYDNASSCRLNSRCDRGYDSECAVLFPEMVSVAERQPNHWARSSVTVSRPAAGRRTGRGPARDEPAPDAARLLVDPWVAQQSYILWI